MEWHERLCDDCKGAGENRFKRRGLHPAMNVANCYDCEVDGEPGYRRRCLTCDGVGFLPIKSLPPLIKPLDQS